MKSRNNSRKYSYTRRRKSEPISRVSIVPDNSNLISRLKKDVYPGKKVILECFFGEDRRKSIVLSEGTVLEMDKKRIVVEYENGKAVIPYETITGYEVDGGHIVREERRKNNEYAPEERRRRVKAKKI